MAVAPNHETNLRVLIVEDNEDDALMLVDTLESNNYHVDWLRVQSEPELLEALNQSWHLVFSDFSMPGFSGAKALEILRQRDPDIPFIFVSGTLGEEAAVQAIKSGAQDYVMKGQLTRVVPTVERELRDVQLRREHRQIEASRTRLAAILEATPDLVMLLGPDGGLHYINSACRNLLGLGPDEEPDELYLEDFFPEPMAEQIRLSILPATKREGLWSGESVLQSSEGGEIPISLVLLAHHGEDRSIEYLSAIARDISERKHHEAEMQHKATHDGLTDLPNRFLLMDRFNSALEHAKRSGKLVAVMFLDMDNFKRVNDSLGHAAGDRLLQVAGRRLQNILRPVDTVARHGGDEFTIVLDELAQVEDILTVLHKIGAAFERPFSIDANEVYVTFSTGIAVYPHDGEYVEDLLRNADTAMYRAKSSGSSQYRFYAPAMNARGRELLALEADLRRALEHNEYLLYFQPQMDLQEGRMVGTEALIRWQHPQHGLISPADFIPLLEKSGFIVPVGEWVIRKACEVQRKWAESSRTDLRISVNVSAAQFNDKDFFGKVHRAVLEEKIPPHMLELEITENIVMQEPETASEILKALHALGIRTAIDDFGTGYSSLAYLKRFPLNVLKIDQTFIHDLGRDPSDDAIVEASISMARKLGLDTVAEGVETAEQLDFLRERGCRLVQGYYLGRPAPEAEFSALMTREE
jgi:diguanylate cyclase (GGDEF)-like protein/PAS domain S-box-containing protein